MLLTELHNLGKTLLSKAVEKFPEDAMTNFNLGCYLCKMGEIEKAKEYVGKSIKLDGKFKILALDDSDLEPLWQEFENKSAR